jgi:hypothetical protein
VSFLEQVLGPPSGETRLKKVDVKFSNQWAQASAMFSCRWNYSIICDKPLIASYQTGPRLLIVQGRKELGWASCRWPGASVPRTWNRSRSHSSSVEFQSFRRLWIQQMHLPRLLAWRLAMRRLDHTTDKSSAAPPIKLSAHMNAEFRWKIQVLHPVISAPLSFTTPYHTKSKPQVWHYDI